MSLKPYIIALGLAVSSCATPQITPQKEETLQEKVSQFLVGGKVRQEYYKGQYILRERIRERNVTSLAREYDLKGKKFIEYFGVYPRALQKGNDFYIPVTTKPYWYEFDGNHYKDFKVDGINGNEEQLN